MCTISKKRVKWNIEPEFIQKIKTSLNNDKDEIAGVLLFTDTNCKDGVCDKKSTKYKINHGNGGLPKADLSLPKIEDELRD